MENLLIGIVDLGKTHARLIVLDDEGSLVAQRQQSCRTFDGGMGYSALNTAATEAWLIDALASLGTFGPRLKRLFVTTHGAAVAVMQGDTLALPIPDYEWEGFNEHRVELEAEFDAFSDTLSPSLPRGLNMGVQLDWLQRHCSDAMQAADTLLPYAQYWSWWLCGVKASEVSSLGCHTQLWRPFESRFTDWACSRRWPEKFAPMRKAWSVLGTLRSELASRLKLPRDVLVYTGVHDSNACLARYMRHWPRMTLVSTGTWVVVMSPGAPVRALSPGRDLLGNVSVRGEFISTGRFMGGREFALLCAGAEPAHANVLCLKKLLDIGLRILPGFESQGGPFAQNCGQITVGNSLLSLDQWTKQFSSTERASAASFYVAQVMVWLIQKLGGVGPVVLEGPFSNNPVVAEVLAALLPGAEIYAGVDPVEGTARGGWCLTKWTEPDAAPPLLKPLMPNDSQFGALVRRYHEDWSKQLPKY